MLSLRLQVFLAFLGFAAVLLLMVFGYSRISFETRFESYILQRENARNAELIDALKRHYEAEGNFDYFVRSPHAWDIFTRPRRNPELRQAAPARDANGRRQERDGREGRDNRREWRARLVLLDADKHELAGRRDPRSQYVYAEIRSQRDLAGFLAIPVNQLLRDLADTQFIDQEQSRATRMLLLALIGAFAFAIPLAYLLTRKIKRIEQQVQLLSAGDYRAPLVMSGSDEFARLADGLNHLGQTLAANEASRKRWMADISHELRTPLAVLKADLEALSDGIRPFTPDTLVRLSNHTDRLHHLINDLYQLSLTDIGAMQYRKAPCELRELIEPLIHSLIPSFEARGLRLQLELPQAPITLFADAERLQQLLLNLLNNAKQYTQSPGEVYVRLSLEAGAAIIRVEDTAPGVSEDELEKIFERLYRAEHSRSRDSGGAGLGLSICRNIVAAHGGHLAAHASAYGGLCVRVQLPLQATGKAPEAAV